MKKIYFRPEITTEKMEPDQMIAVSALNIDGESGTHEFIDVDAIAAAMARELGEDF